LNLPTNLTYVKTVDISGCALTGTAVNNLLTQLDANGISGGSVDVSGGTNAAPSGAGLTAKTNLIAKGWTVTTN
jgi:hypothetical protein